MKALLASLVACVALSACGGGGTAEPLKLRVLGNSLTYAPATPELGWTHDGGMAASDAAHDFAHLVAHELNAELTAINVARLGLEGNAATDPINRVTESPIADAIAQAAAGVDGSTIVVVQLGDNATAATLPAFSSNYRQILVAVAPASQIVCVSTWWRDDAKDAAMHEACDRAGGRWVAIGDVHADPAYPDRDSTAYADPRVNRHPHDFGMARIAERVIAAVAS